MTPRERLLLDLTIFAVVVAAANPAVTGISLHEWLGFVLVVPTLAHLLVNWEWVLRTVVMFLGKLRTASRANLFVDAGLFGSLVAVTLSGVLVIPGLATSTGLDVSSAWHGVHLLASNLAIGFTLAHFALHWRWVASVAGRWLFPAAPAPVARRATAPAATAAAQPTPSSAYLTVAEIGASSAPVYRR